MITIRKQGEESFQYESPEDSPDFSPKYGIRDELYPDENGNWIIEWHDNQDYEGRILFDDYEEAKTFFDEIRSILEEHGFKEKLPSNPKERSERTNPDKENQKNESEETPSDNKKRSETVSPNNNQTEDLDKNSKNTSSDTLKKHQANPRYRALKKKYEKEFRDDWSFEKQYLTFFFGQYLLALPGVILGEILLPAIGIGGLIAAVSVTVTDIAWESAIRYAGNEKPMTLSDVVIQTGVGVVPSAAARAASSSKNVVDNGLSASMRASSTSSRPPTGLEKHELNRISEKYQTDTELIRGFTKGEPGVKLDGGAHPSETSHVSTSNWLAERAKNIGMLVEKEHLHDPRALLSNNRRNQHTVDLRAEDKFRPDRLNMVVELKSKVKIKNGRISAGRGKSRKKQIASLEQSAQRRPEKLHAIIDSEGKIAIYDPISKTWSFLKSPTARLLTEDEN